LHKKESQVRIMTEGGDVIDRRIAVHLSLIHLSSCGAIQRCTNRESARELAIRDPQAIEPSAHARQGAVRVHRHAASVLSHRIRAISSATADRSKPSTRRPSAQRTATKPARTCCGPHHLHRTDPRIVRPPSQTPRRDSQRLRHVS
jgi:hypothetical protein